MEPSSSSTSDSPTRLILKRYVHLQHTRLSLLKELETVLESCLSKPIEKPEHLRQEQQHHPTEVKDSSNLKVDAIICDLPASRCRHEYKDVDSNPDDYIEQVISISTSGFLEIREEAKLLLEMLETNLNRSDLFNLLNKVEDLDAKKMSEHLQRNVLRRKEILAGHDYTDAISTHQKQVDLLTESISNLMAEVQAELSELL